MRQLESEGLIESSATRRPGVADPSLEELAQNLSVLGALEGLACEQASANATDAQIEEIGRICQRMEAELGLALFVRDRGRLVPTRENRILQGQIAGLVDHGARLATRAAELRSGNSAAITLRVAFPASLTLSIVPEIIADFLAHSNRVQVELHTGAYDTIERMLVDERAEIGFVRVPIQRSNLVPTPLIEARTVCVMPRDHPLAAQAEISVSDLHGVALILLGRMRQPRREIDELFWTKGLRPLVKVEAHSVQSACALAARGLGVTLVNELMARDYGHLPVVTRPLSEPLVHRFAFATSEGVPMSEAARSFMRIATDRFRGLLAAG